MCKHLFELVVRGTILGVLTIPAIGLFILNRMLA